MVFQIGTVGSRNTFNYIVKPETRDVMLIAESKLEKINATVDDCQSVDRLKIRCSMIIDLFPKYLIRARVKC